MHRTLLEYAPWVAHFVTARPIPSLLLPPEHYSVLHEVIPILAQCGDEPAPELPLKVSPAALLALPFAAARRLLRELALSRPKVCALALDHVIESLPPAWVSLMFTASLSSAPHFAGLLRERLDRLLAAVVPFTGDSRVLSALWQAISPLGQELPFSAMQFIALLLTSPGSKARSRGLAAAAAAPERFRDFLQPYVSAAFAGLLEDSSGARGLAAALDSFPQLACSHRDRLLALASECLASGREQLPLLGSIFDRLLPDCRTSRVLGESQGDVTTLGALSIPAAALAQCEDVWRLIAKHFGALSQLIAESPSLLRSHLRFLLKCPEVLDLRQKTAYFRELQNGKLNRGRLKIEVRRGEVLRDSFRRLRGIRPAEWLGRLFIRFRDEPGIDDGGLTREWFELLVRALFNPEYMLFGASKNHGGLQPHPSSPLLEPEASEYFTFAGAVVARAMIQNIAIDAHLTSSFLKHLIGRPPALRDVQDVDPAVHASLSWLQNSEVTADQELYFAVPRDELRASELFELIPGGAGISVTEANKAQYISLVVQYMLRGRIEEQIEAFCQGFHGLIPREEIAFLEPSELDLLICGVPEVSVPDLRANCHFAPPYHGSHPVISALFNILGRWDSEKLAKFLIFVTGSSQVPLGGFATLRQAGSPITIQPGGMRGWLPCAHTCLNTLDLPEYEDEDDMQNKLLTAIYESSTFTLA
jgi:hypothetical protein